MVDREPNEAADDASAMQALDVMWRELGRRLGAHLGTMTDPEEGDHLLVEIADPDPDGDGCPPYAQFAAFGDGTMLRAEISGNAYLLPQYRLDEAGCDYLLAGGWEGNEGDEKNWFIQVPVSEVAAVADRVVSTFRFHFGIAHPQLLTYCGWGPAASAAPALGLCATADVPVEEPQAPQETLSRRAGPRPRKAMQAVTPADRDELVDLVRQTLAHKYDDEPEVDDDGDFVLEHLGQLSWIRVRHDTPTVEIMARVAHDVRSRRATAVEVGLLNRDHPWVRWVLRDRTIWQTVVVPGLPIVPQHLDDLLDVFFAAMTSTRDDLALRTRAKVG